MARKTSFEAGIAKVKSVHPESAGDIDRVLESGVSSCDDLIAAMDSMGAEERSTAAWLMGRLGTKRHARGLLKYLQSDDRALGTAAATSISVIGGKAVVRPLLDIMRKGARADYREAAGYALSFLMAYGYSRPVLEAYLDVLNDENEAPAVRAQVCEGLNYIDWGDRRRRLARRVIASLLRALGDASPEVRFWACFAIGKYGVRRALPALKALAEKDKTLVPGWWTVGEEAADAITTINGGFPPDRVMRRE
ncbi:MAG: HEAT repeat domain-containing protein [Proteobacteria bacterium]|nr:HEAT repeat domain-containing protein [Pseudomonadota bacterium]